MTTFQEINRMSWNLAGIALMIKDKKIQPYSSSQLRIFMSAAMSVTPDASLNQIVSHYSPQPARKIKGRSDPHEIKTINEMKKTHCLLGNEVKKAFLVLNRSERVILIKYLMWNLRIVEQICKQRSIPAPDMLTNLSHAEGQSIDKNVLEKILALHKILININDNTQKNRGYHRGG